MTANKKITVKKKVEAKLQKQTKIEYEIWKQDREKKISRVSEEM